MGEVSILHQPDMKKGQMMELIQKLIHDAAVEQLRKRKKVSPHEAPEMTIDELDKILFDGNMERDNSRRFGIREGDEKFENIAKINSSDITDFQNKMNEIVANSPNAVLSFDQQPNGYVIMLKNGDPINVVANGKIVFGNQGEMTWMFSIPNGFRVQTEGLQIDQSNKDIITNLANYYDTWQKDWRQKMLSPNGGDQEEEGKQDFRAPEAQTMSGGATQQADAGSATFGGPATPAAGAPPAA